MPLLKFFRREADVEIGVDKTIVQPGDELEVHVEFMPKQDFSIRQGIVKLERIERSVGYQSGDEDSAGYYYERRDNVSMREEIFMGGGDLHSMRSYSADAKFAVPPDALPTVVGPIKDGISSGISYEIKVNFDIPMAFDVNESQEIVVLPSSPTDLPVYPVSATSKRGRALLTLSLERSHVSSGDKVKGILHAEPRKDARVSEVAVELVTIQKFGYAEQCDIIDSASLEFETMLYAGRHREWPFELDVGQVEVPSISNKYLDDSDPSMRLTHDSSVMRVVRAKLDLKWARDPKIELDVQAYVASSDC